MRRRKRARALAMAAAMVASITMGGCYKATFVRDLPPAGPVQSEWVRFHLFGLIGVHDLDVRDHCPDGSVRILRTGSSAGTAVVTILTAGIYSPRKLWIQCGDREAALARWPATRGDDARGDKQVDVDEASGADVEEDEAVEEEGL
jgi:hypothetical protein